MAEWLIEEGIGEHRAVLVEHGEIIAARLDWPGSLAAGLVSDAVLVSRTTGRVRLSTFLRNRPTPATANAMIIVASPEPA